MDWLDEIKSIKLEKKVSDLKQDFQKYTKDDDNRKRQIKIGEILFSYRDIVDAKVSSQEIVDTEKRRVGRPIKKSEDKVIKKSFWANKGLFEYIYEFLPVDGGLGARIKFLAEYFRRVRKRELEQIKVIQGPLNQLAKSINKYSRNVNRSEKSMENDQTISDVDKLVDHILLLLQILNFKLVDLRKELSLDQMKMLELAMFWKENKTHGCN